MILSLWLVGWWGTESVLSAQTSREYDLKAVLLFNLTRFVEWPPEAFADAEAPLVIGILGQDPYGAVLDEVVRLESYGRHKIQVKRYADLAAVKDCQILFIAANESGRLPRILTQVESRPILTVADFEGFPGRGGMVGLQQNAEGKIRLCINLDAVRSCRLGVSGKLLRVAEVLNVPKP